MKFGIQYDIQPQKFLKKADKHIAQRIVDKTETLLQDQPVPHDAKAIVGRHGVFRIRIGDYRVLYRVDNDNHHIIIFAIDIRERVY